MQAKVSSKGQVVLPLPLRRRLGLAAGDALDAAIERGRIVLTPKRARRPRPRIVKDVITGLPVLSVPGQAPVLTAVEVAEILANFP